MKLSVILPTIGRPTLQRAIDSIPEDPRVQVVLIGDGVPFARNGRFVSVTRYPRSGDAGYSARNLGLPAATGDWLAFMDDDDYFTPDGVRTILDYCEGCEDGRPAVFRMQRLSSNDSLWWVPKLQLGNQGQQQFVCRNTPGLPRWKTHYSADFDWMQEVEKLHGPSRFMDQTTVVMPVQQLGK